jgi:hypothetical protein
VCGVVIEEASREGEVTGSNHDSRVVSRLYAKKMRDLMTGTGGCLVGGVPLPNSFFYFESISKIHCAGGRLCHPPALWFRGGGVGTRQQRQPFVLAQDCWRVLRPPTQMPFSRQCKSFMVS